MGEAATDDLTPHFEDIQAHYDISDDFYRLFLDRRRPTAAPISAR